MKTNNIQKYILIPIYIVITVFILFSHIRIIVPFPVILLFTLILLSLWVPLVFNQNRNKEGKYFDYWSIIHGLSGILLGLLSIPFLWTCLLIVLWEFTEIKSYIYEEYTNRIMDILLGLSGWCMTVVMVYATITV